MRPLKLRKKCPCKQAFFLLVLRGYYYDVETGLYYLNTRYYDPFACRFINADDISYIEPETINGLNLYSYCGNNPVMGVDPNGTAWWHWILGVGIIIACAALTVITAGGFAAAGTAFLSVVSATMAPTAMSAIFAGATLGAAAMGVSGLVMGGLSGDNGWSWEKSSQGFMMGSAIGAVIGGLWGGIHYALQNAGKMAVKISMDKLINNPLDEFVTSGPKDGAISKYIQSISETGNYGKIYVSKLQNGMFQIANGHHRVAALRRLGYEAIKIFLTN